MASNTVDFTLMAVSQGPGARRSSPKPVSIAAAEAFDKSIERFAGSNKPRRCPEDLIFLASELHTLAVHCPAEQLGASVLASIVLPEGCRPADPLLFSSVARPGLSAGSAAEALPAALQHCIASRHVATRTMRRNQMGISLNMLFQVALWSERAPPTIQR